MRTSPGGPSSDTMNLPTCVIACNSANRPNGKKTTARAKVQTGRLVQYSSSVPAEVHSTRCDGRPLRLVATRPSHKSLRSITEIVFVSACERFDRPPNWPMRNTMPMIGTAIAKRMSISGPADSTLASVAFARRASGQRQPDWLNVAQEETSPAGRGGVVADNDEGVSTAQAVRDPADRTVCGGRCPGGDVIDIAQE